jgi:hypothetical protein
MRKATARIGLRSECLFALKLFSKVRKHPGTNHLVEATAELPQTTVH